MLETPAFPRDSRQEHVVPAAALKELLIRLYVKQGMFRAEAEMVAARQVEADLRGVQSHGCRATPRYLAAMDRGDIDPRGQTLTVKQLPALALLDGSHNLGHVAATRGMQLAIELARAAGTGTVVIRDSQHFGAASVYALMAAQEGMLAYVTTSTGGATVSAYGSDAAATANNAFAWAAPTRSGPPFCLDMACAVSSWGKVHAWNLYGLPTPPGWALTASGEPTEESALAKILRPAAGARGYGLALQCALLAGPLAGGRMPLHKRRATEVECSEHFLYVIDIAQVTDIDEYYKEVDATFAEIRDLPAAAGCEAVTIPGEIEARLAAERLESGIPIHRATLDELEAAAKRFKIVVPWNESQSVTK